MTATAQKRKTFDLKQAPAPRQNGRPARISYVVGQLDRLLKRTFMDVLSKHGLTLPQFTALSVINSGGVLTNAKLAERSFITPQSANEVVKTMEANGWVGRSPTHARLVQLSLTDEGRRVLQECDVAIDQLEASMLTGLTEIPLDTLRVVLQRCVTNLRT
ncbi:MarR family winged helix-turn-helix transcriptional regulator [Paraburkholderia tropica]|uniref:MarR family winged helix-turn-helix transcriptional regulator n=1 Tax=Paraburkholderia tropica TaxID=92647 RepID=UPI001F28BD2C|nr:MarR family transcriptional regulator [Paraburkholderia tropica]